MMQMDLMLEDLRYENELRKYRRIANPSDNKGSTGGGGKPGGTGKKTPLNESEAIKLFQRLIAQVLPLLSSSCSVPACPPCHAPFSSHSLLPPI
jgi:hypothetical protein